MANNAHTTAVAQSSGSSTIKVSQTSRKTSITARRSSGYSQQQQNIALQLPTRIPAQDSIEDDPFLLDISQELLISNNEHEAFIRAAIQLLSELVADSAAPPYLFRALVTINRGIEAFLRDGSRHVPSSVTKLYLRLVSKARSRLAESACEYLTIELNKIQIRAEAQSPRLEAAYQQFARVLLSTAPSTPAGVESSEWHKFAVAILDHKDKTKLIYLLVESYKQYQDEVYHQHEPSRYWLAVWRKLRTCLSNSNIPHLDANFTEQTRVRQLRAAIFGSTVVIEPLHQEAIEELVGRYCLHVQSTSTIGAESSGTKNAAMYLQENSQSPAHTVQRLESLAHLLNESIKKAKKIEGIIRQPGSDDYQIESFPKFNARMMREGLQSAVIDDHVTAADTIPQQVNFQEPDRHARKSGFDYVSNPLPETRAHEIAASEQINREMTSPGTYSDGPREQYIRNDPPRHARPPENVSYLPRVLSFGPTYLACRLAILGCRLITNTFLKRFARRRGHLTSRLDPRRPSPKVKKRTKPYNLAKTVQKPVGLKEGGAHQASRSNSHISNSRSTSLTFSKSQSPSAAPKRFQNAFSGTKPGFVQPNTFSADYDTDIDDGRDQIVDDTKPITDNETDLVTRLPYFRPKSRPSVAYFGYAELDIVDPDFDKPLKIHREQPSFYMPQGELWTLRQNGEKLVVVLDKNQIMKLMDTSGQEYEVWEFPDYNQVRMMQPGEEALDEWRYVALDEETDKEESDISSTVPKEWSFGFKRSWDDVDQGTESAMTTPRSPKRVKRFPSSIISSFEDDKPERALSEPLLASPITPVTLRRAQSWPPRRSLRSGAPSPEEGIYQDPGAGSTPPPPSPPTGRSPLGPVIPRGPPPSNDPPCDPPGGGPRPRRCHACPTYRGQYHHICTDIHPPRPGGICPGNNNLPPHLPPAGPLNGGGDGGSSRTRSSSSSSNSSNAENRPPPQLPHPDIHGSNWNAADPYHLPRRWRGGTVADYRRWMLAREMRDEIADRRLDPPPPRTTLPQLAVILANADTRGNYGRAWMASIRWQLQNLRLTRRPPGFQYWRY